ncbi:unnamed protein product, partial [Allacma fusca]
FHSGNASSVRSEKSLIVGSGDSQLMFKLTYVNKSLFFSKQKIPRQLKNNIHTRV